jgi:hypothetical protein
MAYELSNPFCPDGTPCRSIIYPQPRTRPAMLISHLLPLLPNFDPRFRTEILLTTANPISLHHTTARWRYSKAPVMNGSSGPSGMIDQTSDAKFIQKSSVSKLVNHFLVMEWKRKRHSHPIGIRTVLRPRRLMSSKSFLTIQLDSRSHENRFKTQGGEVIPRLSGVSER